MLLDSWCFRLSRFGLPVYRLDLAICRWLLRFMVSCSFFFELFFFFFLCVCCESQASLNMITRFSWVHTSVAAAKWGQTIYSR
jgi:hypothetical protein